MHIDPFEEIEMAEKKAEDHRRSAAEKDVRTAMIIDTDKFVIFILLNTWMDESSKKNDLSRI